MQVTDQEAPEHQREPEPAPAPEPEATPAARPLRRAPATRELLLAAAGFLVLSLVAYLPAWLHGPSRELAIGSGKDNMFGPWWMQWDAWALVHGANPFYSHFLNAPTGVNLMLNPVTHAVGYLLAPVTLLFGPIASWNVAMTLGIAGNGLAAYVLLRRFVRWWAAVPGALLYGFGPYVVAQGLGHINFVIVPVPPLLLWLAYHVVADEDARPVRSGVVVGLLVAVQLLISPEVLAQTAIVVAIGGFIWLALEMRPNARLWPPRLIRLAKAGAAALATALPLVAYPTWMLFDGPQHVRGPAATFLRLFRSDLRAPTSRPPTS